MDYSEFDEQPRRGAFKSHKKKKKGCARHKRIVVEGTDCQWVTDRWFYTERIYVRWQCQCRSVCTVCGDSAPRGRGRRSWRKEPNCCHKEYRDATQPDKIGWIYP